jgi:hypothetical protein
MNDTIDSKGFPTEESLLFLREYKTEQPFKDIIELIRYLWHYADWGFVLHRKYKGKQKLELHTGGWSGNEEIIQAILSNIYLTHFHMKYYMWKTGGHYYFEIEYK